MERNEIYAVIDTNVLVSALLAKDNVTLSKDDAYLVTGNIKHFPKKPFVRKAFKKKEIEAAMLEAQSKASGGLLDE